MSTSKRDLYIEKLEAANAQSAARYCDLQLAVWRHEDGYFSEEAGARVPYVDAAPLLRVGGRWDNLERRYLGSADTEVQVVLEPSEHGAGEDFAVWLRRHLQVRAMVQRGWSFTEATRETWGDEPPWFVGLCYGGRGGGKSWWACGAMAALALAIPGSRYVMASPKQSHTLELLLALEASWLAQDWRIWKASDQRIELINGSVIELITGNQSNLKVGRIDGWVLNEGQEQNEINMIDLQGCSIKVGGLGLVTCNPSRSVRGQWTVDIYQDVKRGRRRSSRVYLFDPTLNEQINAIAIEAAAENMDERTYAREIKGDMGVPAGDIVLTSWSDTYNQIEWMPTSWKDVTKIVAERWYGATGRRWIGGLDFDQDDGCAFVVGRFYLPLDRLRGREPKIEDAVCVVHYGHRFFGRYDETLDEDLRGFRDEHGYPLLRPEEVVFVADASGTWQGRSRKPKEHRPPEDKPSWQRLTPRGWQLRRPQQQLLDNPKPVSKRHSLMRRLLRPEEGTQLPRIMFLVPQAEEACEAAKKWPMRGRKPDPDSEHEHLNDCWGYMAWRRWGEEFEGTANDQLPVLGGYQGVPRTSRASRLGI